MAREVKISDIKQEFFVRTETKQDRVIIFRDMYLSKKPVKPIVLDKKTREVIDGRHRIDGAKLAGLTTIPCVFVETKGRSDKILRGFKANCGGALPPSTDDIKLVISLLIKSGLSRKKILDRLADAMRMEKRSILYYYKDVSYRILQRNIQKAKDAMMYDRMTIDEAAAKYKVTVAQIQKAVEGKRKHKRNIIAEAKSAMSTKQKNFASSMGQHIRKVIEHYDVGDVSEDDVKTIVKHYKRLVSHLQDKAFTWQSRTNTRLDK